MSTGNAEAHPPTENLDDRNATAGVDTVSSEICAYPPVPIVVVATHEELLRSARDMWAVTVSLLTELTPDKFATAPWAAGLFTAELPFILGKLWHIQQGLIVSAHSYMQTETMLTTFIESIDILKILKQLSTWAIPMNPFGELPVGVTQYVPPVEITRPDDVKIIQQRFDETNWNHQPLVRHEIYQGASSTEHWFYLPRTQSWTLDDGTLSVENHSGLASLIHEQENTGDTKFVYEHEGELIHPELSEIKLTGSVNVYRLEQL